MSQSYYLACQKCKSYVWIGQSQNSAPPFCFYSGDMETMKQLRMFFWDHRGHSLVLDDSQVLEMNGILESDDSGIIKGEATA